MADGTFKCHDCHMVFSSLQLLQKHKNKFCVGGKIGDPDDLMLRRGLWSEGTPSPRPLSPDDRKKRETPRKPVDQKEKKYERLRAKEAMLQESGLPVPLPHPHGTNNHAPLSARSINIHLPTEVEYQKYNPNQDSQIRQLAENHGRQMEYLQLQNRDLEKQREDIRRRLMELAHKGPEPKYDNTSELLAELRAQEQRNQKALDDLKRQLYDINHQRVNFIEVEKPGHHYPPPPQPQPLPHPESNRKSYVYPVYYGNSLVAEISAMRQAYLQNGGNDPDILTQMSQMQAEAQSIEDSMKQVVPEKREKKGDNLSQLRMLEMENDRLHKELMLLQQQNFRKKSDREDELENELRRLQEEQLRKMLQLQNEIEMLKRQSMMPQPTARLPPPQPNNADMPWLLQRPYVDVEPMQPYDQYPNRYAPTAHHTWVATQHYKTSRPPPTSRPNQQDNNYDIDDID